MRLEALELVEGRQRRIVVVQMNDEADRNEVLVEVIEEGATAGLAVERPAEGVLHAACVMLLLRDAPQLFEADAEFLRLAVLVELKFRDELLRERAARALCEQGVAPAQLHPARKTLFVMAVLGDAHVARRDAQHLAVVAIENL